MIRRCLRVGMASPYSLAAEELEDVAFHEIVEGAEAHPALEAFTDFANVFREALACGTPFVSTDVGSIREIADPAYARCVTGRDPLEFAQAVQDILQPEYREAAEMYAPRTWDDCAAEVVELLSPRSTTVSAKPVPQVLSTGR